MYQEYRAIHDPIHDWQFPVGPVASSVEHNVIPIHSLVAKSVNTVISGALTAPTGVSFTGFYVPLVCGGSQLVNRVNAMVTYRGSLTIDGLSMDAVLSAFFVWRPLVAGQPAPDTINVFGDPSVVMTPIDFKRTLNTITFEGSASVPVTDGTSLAAIAIMSNWSGAKGAWGAISMRDVREEQLVFQPNK